SFPDAEAGADAGILGTFVNCGTGSDTTDAGSGGLESSPWKTIGHAVSMAAPGQTIWVQDGTCDDTTEPTFAGVNVRLDVPDGVSIRAVNPGQVTFRGSPSGFRAASLRFLGSGTVEGIHFERFGRGIEASSGTLTLRGVSFDDVYQGRPLELSGTVVATVEPGSLTNYIGTNQRGFARVEGSARLTVNGGTISGALDSGISGDTVFVVDEQAELVLDAFTLTASTLSGIQVRGSAKATVRGGSLLEGAGSSACCNQSGVNVSGSATFELLASRIDGSRGPGILCSGAGAPTILLRDAEVTGGTGHGIEGRIYSDCRPTLTLERSKITGNRSGIYLNYGGDLTITDSFIDDNGSTTTQCGSGIHYNDASRAQSLVMRRTSVQRNCQHGVLLDGAATSVFDLGRGDDPGVNTLSGNHVGGAYANLYVEANETLTVHAAGNTWEPGVQGAAASGSTSPLPGQYDLVSANTRDVTGAQSGVNHIIAGANAATSTLRLAEAACVPAGTCP
ncbi:MAG: right-handed parallel beta-helix repeat-containing protein, partial [Deltaproteobacteria bacterium]|nr:right-handed parallel beta-helix repeat-containing protein [Deltaproteobacteria bacterium]